MGKRHLIGSALALILMTACGDDGTGLETDDLAGTWTAASMIFTQTAAPMEPVDLVAQDMAVLTLVLTADSTYTFTFVFPPDTTANENETGTYAVVGDTLTLNPTGTGSPEEFEIARDDDTMTLTDSGEMFEFDPMVGDEDATLVITLTR